MLEIVKHIQTYWSDNSVSCTVYYRYEELAGITEWLTENYQNCVKSCSFMLYSEHGFAQAPLEELTEEQYLELTAPLTALTAATDSGGELMDDLECSSGGCPIR
jgi:ribonucleoside-triphosphate reductase (thioredoxin)